MYVFRDHLIELASVKKCWLSPAGQGLLSEDYETLSVWACLRLCVVLLCFYLNCYISFIYEYIFTKFAENVYGYEHFFCKNFWCRFENQNGRHSQFLENH